MIERFIRCSCLPSDRLQSLSSTGQQCSCQPKRHIVELLKRIDDLFGDGAAQIILPTNIVEDSDSLTRELEAIVQEAMERKHGGSQ